jgi:citrate lyase beta subunit
MLYMPGDDLKKIAKGAALAVDCVILDLEDGVAWSRKEAARQTIALALAELDFGPKERLVRVNPLGSGLEWDDLNAALSVPAGVLDGIVLPKSEDGGRIAALDTWLSEQEAQRGWPVGHLKLFAIIESALGVLNLKEIAQASPRLAALMFGAEDLAGNIGAVRTPAMSEVMAARSWVVLHAKAYGLEAIDTPYTDIHHLEGLAAEAEQARQWGYDGKMAVHPTHVPVIEAAFRPSEAEIAHAQALIQAYEEHQRGGSSVFTINGKLVEMPMIRAAQDVLRRATL